MQRDGALCTLSHTIPPLTANDLLVSLCVVYPSQCTLNTEAVDELGYIGQRVILTFQITY